MSFENTYSQLPPIFFNHERLAPLPRTQTHIYNHALATELWLWELLSEKEMLEILLSWNRDDTFTPLSQAYAGHQFGHFTMLGDWRALLLAEWRDESGKLFDIALKWSGETKYSRWGDGRATLKAMTREYIISECMHSLGIETSRSLSIIKTWEVVLRHDIEVWAILVRVMPSHLRVGTFEFARVFWQESDLKSLFEYTRERHFREIQPWQESIKVFLEQVIDKQTSLVADWIRVWFIHGVMNTDNTSIAGTTFDYGPCSFLNIYHREQAFSSIDTWGRYSFQNQRDIIVWNLSILIQCFDIFLSKQEMQELIFSAHDMMEKKYFTMMASKLGIKEYKDSSKQVIDRLLELMQKSQLDYTNTFVYLSWYEDIPNKEVFSTKEFKDWKKLWYQEIAKQDGWVEKTQKSMRLVNPFIIPRNHIVEELIENSQMGDVEELNSFLEVFKNPYNYSQIDNRYRTFPPWHDAVYQTFCGT
jgi:serine/tyrosine/threonine adenylyltransferase